MTYVVAPCHGEPLEFGVDVSFLSCEEMQSNSTAKCSREENWAFATGNMRTSSNAASKAGHESKGDKKKIVDLCSRSLDSMRTHVLLQSADGVLGLEGSTSRVGPR